MAWDVSPLSHLVAWCDACACGFDPATGKRVATHASALVGSLPSPSACPDCRGRLALRRQASDTASHATQLQARTTTLDHGPGDPSKATTIDPPRAGAAGTAPPASGAEVIPGLGAIQQARIGPYRIERELGRGGMGVVYLAHDDSLGRAIALKVLPYSANTSNDPEWIARFEREARATAQLSHPNLVAVQSVGATPGCRYIAMDLVQGRSLEGVFSAEGMTTERAVRITWQAAQGLAHAHAHGVIHRDIKPSNILLEHHLFSGSEMRISRRERAALEQAARFHGKALGARAAAAGSEDGTSPGQLVDDVVRITDFGLAVSQQTQRLTVEGAILGTPAYMSPEQTLGRSADARPSMDVYSLGATLYELVTGAPPFQAPETPVLFQMIQDQDPVAPRRLNPRVDRDLETILLKCLEKEPARRYTDARELADDLRRWLDDEPVAARRPSAIERWRRKIRRNPAPYAWSAIFLALIGGLIGWESFDLYTRHVGFRTALDQAAAALSQDQIEQARECLDRASALLPARPETLLAAERIERRQSVVQMAALAVERGTAWRQARTQVAELARQCAAASERTTTRADMAERAGIWDLETKLTTARAVERAEREALVSHLTAVLGMDPGHAAAREALFGAYRELFQDAEAAGDAAEARTWESKLRETDGTRAEQLLGQPARLAVDSDPAGARAWILRYTELGRVQIPLGPGQSVWEARARQERLSALAGDPSGARLPALEARGLTSAYVGANIFRLEAPATPTVMESLPPGHYLVILYREGHEAVRRPVRLVRGETVEIRLALPKQGEVPRGFVLVPEGAYRAGPAAVEATLPEFAMARFEVTAGEYLEFLNDPASVAERAAGGVVRAPRDATHGQPLWPQDPSGTFALPAGLRPDLPVAQIDLEDARAYAAWVGRAHPVAGWQFDLATAAEWEKAARGVDGRIYPWGNGFDPALCAMRDSVADAPAPVGAFPADESPYGVRDLAGSVAEWTLTGDDKNGYQVKGGSWAGDARWCQATSVDLDTPKEIDDENGIRLVARRR